MRAARTIATPLILAAILSAGCAQDRSAPVIAVTPVVVTPEQAHAGAVGTALYACVRDLDAGATRKTYEAVWLQIRDARLEVGDRGVCVQAAALLSCNAGYPWFGVDRYLQDNPGQTCATLIEAVDLSREVRDAR